MDSFEENNSAYIAVVAAVVVVVIFVGVIAVLLKRCLVRKLAARERRELLSLIFIRLRTGNVKYFTHIDLHE